MDTNDHDIRHIVNTAVSVEPLEMFLDVSPLQFVVSCKNVSFTGLNS